MLAKLTLKLAAVPEGSWARFTVAHLQSEPLPSPLMHVVTVALLSAVATGIGGMLRPGATAAGAVLQCVMGIIAYVGGGVLAVWASPPLLTSLAGSENSANVANSPRPELVARYASGAVLPIALSGILNVVPLFPLTFLLALAGAASSGWSGWIGSEAMLALQGDQRKRAALVPAVLAASVVLLATLIRMGLPK